MVGKRKLPAKLREYNKSRAVVSIQSQETTIRPECDESAMGLFESLPEKEMDFEEAFPGTPVQDA